MSELPNKEHELFLPPPESEKLLEMHKEELLGPGKEAKLIERVSRDEQVESAREAIDSVTPSTEEHKLLNTIESNGDKEDSLPDAGSYIENDLKLIAVRRELDSLQRNEGPLERSLSKLIHKPVVRAVSETASRSISRPSGLLGGGMTALIGTTAYYYLARHIGLQYNYGVFLVLFLGGFALGLLAELLSFALTMRKRRGSS